MAFSLFVGNYTVNSADSTNNYADHLIHLFCLFILLLSVKQNAEHRGHDVVFRR